MDQEEALSLGRAAELNAQVKWRRRGIFTAYDEQPSQERGRSHFAEEIDAAG